MAHKFTVVAAIFAAVCVIAIFVNPVLTQACDDDSAISIVASQGVSNTNCGYSTGNAVIGVFNNVTDETSIMATKFHVYGPDQINSQIESISFVPIPFNIVQSFVIAVAIYPPDDGGALGPNVTGTPLVDFGNLTIIPGTVPRKLYALNAPVTLPLGEFWIVWSHYYQASESVNASVQFQATYYPYCLASDLTNASLSLGFVASQDSGATFADFTCAMCTTPQITLRGCATTPAPSASPSVSPSPLPPASCSTGSSQQFKSLACGQAGYTPQVQNLPGINCVASKFALPAANLFISGMTLSVFGSSNPVANVYIYDDQGGRPGQIIQTFTNSTGAGSNTYNAITTYPGVYTSLLAGEEYYLGFCVTYQPNFVNNYLMLETVDAGCGTVVPDGMHFKAGTYISTNNATGWHLNTTAPSVIQSAIYGCSTNVPTVSYTPEPTPTPQPSSSPSVSPSPSSPPPSPYPSAAPVAKTCANASGALIYNDQDFAAFLDRTPLTQGQRVGQAFTLPNSTDNYGYEQSYFISKVSVYIGTPGTGSQVKISIWDSVNANDITYGPKSQIALVIDSLYAVGSGSNTVINTVTLPDISSNSSLKLQGGRIYWLVVEQIGTGSSYWASSSNPSVGGAMNGSATLYSNATTGWYLGFASNIHMAMSMAGCLMVEITPSPPAKTPTPSPSRSPSPLPSPGANPALDMNIAGAPETYNPDAFKQTLSNATEVPADNINVSDPTPKKRDNASNKSLSRRDYSVTVTFLNTSADQVQRIESIPGNAAVLDAIAQSLGLPAGSVGAAYQAPSGDGDGSSDGTSSGNTITSTLLSYLF